MQPGIAGYVDPTDVVSKNAIQVTVDGELVDFEYMANGLVDVRLDKDLEDEAHHSHGPSRE